MNSKQRLTYSCGSGTTVSDSSWFRGCNNAPCACKKKHLIFYRSLRGHNYRFKILSKQIDWVIFFHINTSIRTVFHEFNGSRNRINNKTKQTSTPWTKYHTRPHKMFGSRLIVTLWFLFQSINDEYNANNTCLDYRKL